jgi:sterol desaturase/sphingolipid hydroxylase (fatty acid hydroxylase superfamily)
MKPVFDSVFLVFQKMLEIYGSHMPYILGAIVVFTIVAMFPSLASSPGKYWWRNPGLPTDAVYFLLHSLIGRWFRIPVMLVVVFFLSRTMSTEEIQDYFANGRGPLSTLPFWAQFVFYVVVSDFLLYWIHRGFHNSTLMWPFHAIHHSSKEVDWTTSLRFHPVNIALQSAFVLGLMITLGIPPEVIALAAPIDGVIALWQHSNTKTTLGPLKYVIATPVFHRWHHTMPDEGGNMNFAPTFAFWDYAFGTFYMPEGKLPENFGVDDPHLVEGYAAQLLYPFLSYFRSRENQAPATDPVQPPQA